VQITSLSNNRRAVGDTAGVLNNPPPQGFTYRLPEVGFGLVSLQKNRQSIELFRGFLQELVQEWMRCGKKVMPERAKVSASGMGVPGGQSKDVVWTLDLVPDSWATGKKSHIQLHESDPAFNSWIWRVYWDYLYRAKPNVWFKSDGEVLLNYTSSSGDSSINPDIDPPKQLPPFLQPDSPHMGVWSDAVQWFIRLLNSGYAHLLDRCSYCDRYFVRERGKKANQLYKRRGPRCGDCKGKGPGERTSERRREARNRMLDVAARAWALWKPSRSESNRHAAVAARVNAKCRDDIFTTTGKDWISSLWVSRNEKAIIVRLNNSKGGK
jgi:hypothetical protein